MAFKRKSKTMSILLTMALLLMLWPGVAYGAGPTFMGGALNIDAYHSDTYIRVNVSISEAVYGNVAATTAVDQNDFEFVISPNGGTVTKAAINAMQDTGSGPVDPGDRHFFFHVRLTDDGGTQVAPSGVETITLRPVANSVYNAGGEAMETTQTLTTTLPDRIKPVFAAGYPQAGAAQAAGSKQVQLVVKPLNESVTAYYVIVANNAGAPSAAQVMAGKDSADQAALAAGNGAAAPAGETSLTTGALPADATDYDAYVVIKDAANNAADPVKIDVTTPAAAVANVCEIVGGAPYPTVQAAVNAVAANDTKTIRMLGSFTHDGTITVDSGKNIALNLDGNTLNIHSGAIGSALWVKDNNTRVEVANGTLNVVGNDEYGILVENGGTIDLGGSAQIHAAGRHRGVKVTGNNSAATVTTATGTTGVGNYGVDVASGGQVRVIGDAIGYCAVSVGSSSFAEIGGDAIGEFYGVLASDTGAEAMVTGDAIATDNTQQSSGARAIDGAEITIGGNVVGMKYGAYASSNGSNTVITVGGNVTVTGNSGAGAFATGVNAEVFIDEEITAAGIGAQADSGGKISIDGVINANPYIRIEGIVKGAGDKTLPSTRPGYYTYTDNTSTVWVKDAASPTVPANLRTTGQTSSSISLAWDASTDDGGVDRYKVEMKSGNGAWTQIGTPAVNQFTQNGLSSSTTYLFRVKAVDAAGNESGWSNELSAATTSSGGGGGGGGSSENGNTPSTGSSVTSSGGNVSGSGVTLSIPAGAVQNDVHVQVSQAALTSGMSLPAGSQLVSQVVDIIKDQSGNFAVPVTITMSFNQSQIDPSKYDIAICYFDEESGQWVELDNIEIDLNNGTISGQVEHFTKFAVIAIPKATDTQPEPQPSSTPPADISGHWAKDSIVKLIDAGVMGGYPDGSFQPDKTVTRAEFTAMLVKALKLDPKDGPAFTDTTAHWAKESVGTAAAHGLVSGYDQNTFGPDDRITREQAASIVAWAAGLQAGEEPLNFSDARQVSPWALSSVAATINNAYLSGYPDNSFRPRDYTSRAEAATIIAKLL